MGIRPATVFHPSMHAALAKPCTQGPSARLRCPASSLPPNTVRPLPVWLPLHLRGATPSCHSGLWTLVVCNPTAILNKAILSLKGNAIAFSETSAMSRAQTIVGRAMSHHGYRTFWGTPVPSHEPRNYHCVFTRTRSGVALMADTPAFLPQPGLPQQLLDTCRLLVQSSSMLKARCACTGLRLCKTIAVVTQVLHQVRQPQNARVPSLTAFCMERNRDWARRTCTDVTSQMGW